MASILDIANFYCCLKEKTASSGRIFARDNIVKRNPQHTNIFPKKTFICLFPQYSIENVY